MKAGSIIKSVVILILIWVIGTKIVWPIIIGNWSIPSFSSGEPKPKKVFFEYRWPATGKWTRGLDATLTQKEGIISAEITGGVNPKTNIPTRMVMKFPSDGGNGTYFIREVSSNALTEEGVVKMKKGVNGWEMKIDPTSTKEPTHTARFVEKDEFGY